MNKNKLINYFFTSNDFDVRYKYVYASQLIHQYHSTISLITYNL